MTNRFEQILIDAQAERQRRQAKRREEERAYLATLPKRAEPQPDRAQPIEYREYLRKKIKDLLNE